MALADSYSKKIDDKNKDVIWDATFDAEDVKRLYSKSYDAYGGRR